MRYFFDVVGRSRCEYDSRGTWFSDPDEAYKWTQLLIVVLQNASDSRDFEGGRVRVRAPDGCELLSLPICTIEVEGDRAAAQCDDVREDHMKSLVVKRSIMVSGRRSSVSLEEAFWKGLKEIASNCRLTLSEVVGKIDATRQHSNLSSAIRLFVLDHYRTKIGAALSSDGEQMQLPSGADASRGNEPI